MSGNVPVAGTSLGVAGAAVQPGPLQRRGRRRGLPLVAISIVLVFILVVGGSAVYLASYSPLKQGSEFERPRDVRRSSTAGGLTETRLEYRDGKTTTFGYMLRNAGPFKLTVTDVRGAGREPGALLRQTGLRVLPKGTKDLTVAPDETVAFRRLVLEPGQQKFVVIAARFGGCAEVPAGTRQAYDSLELRFRVLGVFPRKATIGLRDLVSVAAPGRRGCPERR